MSRAFEFLSGGRGVWENKNIFSSVERRSGGRCADRDAVGECGEGVVKYTYRRLIRDALALSGLVRERGCTEMLLRGGGAYETALMILAASALSVPLTFSADGRGAAEGCFTVAEGRSEGADMDRAELAAAVAGRLSLPLAKDALGRGFELSFISEKGSRTYTEETLFHLAEEYASLSSSASGGRTLCSLAPDSPEAVVCALLPALLTGGSAVFAVGRAIKGECARLVRPTRIFCLPETAVAVLSVLKRDGADGVRLPVEYSPKRARKSRLFGERTPLSRHRRLCSARLMRLGGALRSITVLGACGFGTETDLIGFGIVTESVLSSEGAPFIALRTSVSESVGWRLPGGMLADICDVGKGGRGRITLSGEGLCLPEGEPEFRGIAPGGFRFDDWEGLSLVTDLYGYVLPDGSIFAKKCR